ncbi:relaxase/mobilization nuclease domain-containing protein [Glaciimonas sp. GG7]
MIVAIPKQRQYRNGGGKNPFNDLTRYQTENFRLSKEQEVPSFADIISYAADTPQTITTKLDVPEIQHLRDEKCLAIQLHGVTSVLTASAEMNATAAQNSRVKDAAYHYILSWPEHERPSFESIFEAARHSLKALNLQDHQYMLAIHGNTDNLHCHIGVNRVHPITFKSQHLPFAQRTLHRAARESEIKHNWTHDNGIYIVELDSNGKKHIIRNPLIDQGSADKVFAASHRNSQAWTDPDSLISWIRNTVAPQLKDALSDFNTWQQLQTALFRYGILLKHTGGGLRLSCTDSDTGEVLEIASSKALRFLKLSELEARFGKFKTTVPGMTDTEFEKVSPPKNDPWSLSNAENFTGINGNDRSGFKLQSPGNSMQHVCSLDVVDALDGIEMLLPSDAYVVLRTNEASPDQNVRHGDVGRPQQRISNISDSNIPTQPYPGTRIRKRDPEKRRERKQRRAEFRDDLKQRYQRYRVVLREADVPHTVKKKELRNLQREDKQLLVTEFVIRKKALRDSGMQGSDKQVALALLTAEVLEAKLRLSNQHRSQLSELSAARQAPLGWREWLHEQAQNGDQAALSALRGIIYQEKRDARFNNVDHQSFAGLDADTETFLRVLGQLRDDEKKETAIRSADHAQTRPYQCEALLVTVNKMAYRVTGNGNVEFYDGDANHLFTDRGNRITFDKRKVSDEDLRLALMHACEKFGPALTLTGLDPVFTNRMALMADNLGIKILNPELQEIIVKYRANKKKSPTPVAPLKTIVTKTPVINEAPNRVLVVPEKLRGLDDLRAEILHRDPLATFVKINRSKKSQTFIGPLAGQVMNGFAQHLGRNEYALHEHEMPHTLTESKHDSVQIKYKGGKPIYVHVREKSRGGR